MKLVQKVAVFAVVPALIGTVVIQGMSSAPLQAQSTTAGDAVRGARLFLQCQGCHSVAPGAPHKVGPNLFGVMGSRAASKPAFRYSPALTRAQLTWTSATMDRWLIRPTAAVPGTTMAFAGVADPRNRTDLIAYMASLKSRR